MSTDDVTTEPEPEAGPDPETWDPQAWLSGATSTVRTLRVYPHGDIVGRLQEIDERIRLAEAVGDDRALGDATPDALWAERDAIAEAFAESSVLFRVEGRSSSRREAIEKDLNRAAKTGKGKAPAVSEDDKMLHYLADAITAPSGITVDWLRAFRDDVSESQYLRLQAEYVAACNLPPRVDVPFSGTGSGPRRRVQSS